MKSVNIHEAKTHLSKLVEEVLAGEEIILARRGHPIIKLVAIEGAGNRGPLVHATADFRAQVRRDSILAAQQEKELANWDQELWEANIDVAGWE